MSDPLHRPHRQSPLLHPSLAHHLLARNQCRLPELLCGIGLCRYRVSIVVEVYEIVVLEKVARLLTGGADMTDGIAAWPRCMMSLYISWRDRDAEGEGFMKPILTWMDPDARNFDLVESKLSDTT